MALTKTQMARVVGSARRHVAGGMLVEHAIARVLADHRTRYGREQDYVRLVLDIRAGLDCPPGVEGPVRIPDVIVRWSDERAGLATAVEVQQALETPRPAPAVRVPEVVVVKSQPAPVDWRAQTREQIRGLGWDAGVRGHRRQAGYSAAAGFTFTTPPPRVRAPLSSYEVAVILESLYRAYVERIRAMKEHASVSHGQAGSVRVVGYALERGPWFRRLERWARAMRRPPEAVSGLRNGRVSAREFVTQLQLPTDDWRAARMALGLSVDPRDTVIERVARAAGVS